jgi:hypothetical protein
MLKPRLHYLLTLGKLLGLSVSQYIEITITFPCSVVWIQRVNHVENLEQDPGNAQGCWLLFRLTDMHYGSPLGSLGMWF